MVDGKCWECKFYNKTSRNYGECRRMPPPWKVVESGDWCGEFAKQSNFEMNDFIVCLSGFGLSDEQIENIERFLRERLS